MRKILQKGEKDLITHETGEPVYLRTHQYPSKGKMVLVTFVWKAYATNNFVHINCMKNVENSCRGCFKV